jgi:hypothetical protein
MQATFILEFGDLAETTAGMPRAEPPAAQSMPWMKRRREVVKRVVMVSLEGQRQ